MIATKESVAAGAPRAADAVAARQRIALWLVAAAVFTTVVGMAAATFRGDGTAINAFLFLSWEWPHAMARNAERTAVLIVLAASAIALFWPRWPVLLPVAGYVFAEAWCRRDQGGQIFSEWALWAHAPRYLTPVAAMALALGFEGGRIRREAWRRGGEWLLRAAIAVVFAVHGVECIKGHPHFIDLVLSSATNLGGLRVSESMALVQLEWIGVLDCVVAAALLLWPHRVVLAWAAFWGAASAFSRVTAVGWSAYPDVLVRSSHVLIPLALLYRQQHAAEPAVDAETRSDAQPEPAQA